MPAYGDRYVVSETYRSSTDPATDQFQGWLNGPTDAGIANSGGIRALAQPGGGPREFLVFISDSGPSQSQNPWEDTINPEEGTARYWGDARPRDNPDPDNALGNSWVKADYTRTYAQQNRTEAPPVLLFEKPASGQVTFRGVCIITDLQIARHKDDGETVVNYRFDLAILDADAVDLAWIHRKTRTGVDAGGPDAWREWVADGRIRRYSIYKDDIRSKSAQQPTGREATLLEDIRTKLDNPNKGKKLEYLVKYLLEARRGFSNVEVTPPSGDKGVDLTGKVDLLSDAALSQTDTTIGFKAQVKNTKSTVSGKDLSRLASRVDDGELGLFVTTSHFSKQAQEENLRTYPIRLFSGADLVELLLQTELTDGAALSDEVVAEIEAALYTN